MKKNNDDVLGKDFAINFDNICDTASNNFENSCKNQSRRRLEKNNSVKDFRKSVD